MKDKFRKDELKEKLTPLQYNVTVNGATEKPFTGEYYHSQEKGMYTCIVCKAPLFSSEKKYDSGSGWPSFSDIAKADAVELKEDNSLGMKRVEVLCKNCGAHLGHVFEDGPKEDTGKRYCINSAALNFDKKE